MITESEVLEVLTFLQSDIGDEYRSSIQEFDDDKPMMDVTFACSDNMESWTYQTGSNEYTGSAYSFPHWSVVYLGKDDDADALKDMAAQVIDDLRDSIHSSNC